MSSGHWVSNTVVGVILTDWLSLAEPSQCAMSVIRKIQDYVTQTFPVVVLCGRWHVHNSHGRRPICLARRRSGLPSVCHLPVFLLSSACRACTYSFLNWKFFSVPVIEIAKSLDQLQPQWAEWTHPREFLPSGSWYRRGYARNTARCPWMNGGAHRLTRWWMEMMKTTPKPAT